MPGIMEQYLVRLDAALKEAVASAVSEGDRSHLGVLYSAGLDSALIAKFCQDLGYTPLLLAVGTDRSKDRPFIERSRPHFDLPIRFVTVAENQIDDALPAVEDCLLAAGITPDIMHRSLGVGTYLACQAAGETGIGLLLSGQGADALFAGFQKYQRVPLDELPAILARDVQSAAARDFARDQTIAAAFGIEFAAPFLAPDVVDVALAIPPELKLGPDGRKLILRELARRRGLPDFIAQRPKKAMQYSTGIERVVRRLEG